ILDHVMRAVAMPQNSQPMGATGGWRSTYCSYVSKYGVWWSCFDWPGNPAAYYYVTTTRWGATYCCPDQPTWYADYRGRLVVCPGQQTGSPSYLSPRRPSHYILT